MRRPAALDSRVGCTRTAATRFPEKWSPRRLRRTELGLSPGSVSRRLDSRRKQLSIAPEEAIATLKTELLEELRARSPKVELARVAEAFDYSRSAHGDQLRKSGVPYLSHPVATVHILVELLDVHLDNAIACAALLHDTV